MATIFANEGDNLSTTLAVAYTAGSGTLTLATGYGTTVAAKLSALGYPAISSSAPLRFTLTSASFANRSKTSIFLATSLSGDVLSGVTVETGSTDQNFLAGDQWGVLVSSRSMYQLGTAINAIESGTTDLPITDKGGQVYNVLAYGLIADGIFFTCNGTAASAAITIFGAITKNVSVGNVISILGAGTAGAILKTTVASVSENVLTGSITSGTNQLTVTTSPGSPAAGSPIVVIGAASAGGDIYSTVVSVAGNVITIAATVSTTVTNTPVYLNAGLTLATPIVTTVTGASGRCGTDNNAALLNLCQSIRPHTADLRFPTVYFPPGNFFIEPTLGSQAPAGGILFQGAGLSSILATFDAATSGTNIFKGSSGAHDTVFRDLVVNFGTMTDPVTQSSGLWGSASSAGLGNGAMLRLYNVTSLGGAVPLINAVGDDTVEMYGCNIAAVQIISHDGPNSAGVALGMVRVIGGSMQGFGVAGSNQKHGIYLHFGVSCDIATTFKNQTATSTSYALHLNNGTGTAAKITIRSIFESTIIRAILTPTTGRTVIQGSSFACSSNSITTRGITLIDACDFSGCQASPIIDFASGSPSQLSVINCHFFDNLAAVTTSVSAWDIKFNNNYCSQRTAANALSLTTPTAVQVANCYFSDSVSWGRAPTASLPTAANAGKGTSWFDTTLAATVTSDGTNWLRSQAYASNVTVNEGNWVLAGNTAASATSGEIWNDSTQKGFAGLVNGLTHRFVGLLYSLPAGGNVNYTGNGSDVSLSNSTTPTLPANFFVAGKTLRFRVGGLLSASGTPGTLAVKVKLGSVVVAFAGSLAPIASIVTKVFWLDVNVRCDVVGASGQFWGVGTETRGNTTGNNTAVTYGSTATSVATVDTTGTLVPDVTGNFSLTGQTLLINFFTIEALN